MKLNDAIETAFTSPHAGDALLALNTALLKLSREERQETLTHFWERIDARRVDIERSTLPPHTKHELLWEGTQYRFDWLTLEESWPEFPRGDPPPILKLAGILQLDTAHFAAPQGSAKLLAGLERVVSLTMDMTKAFTRADAQRLVRAPAMASVRSLSIERFEEDVDDVPAMEAGAFGTLMAGLPNLEDVYIARVGLQDDALEHMSTLSRCGLKRLNLRENHFTTRGIEALAQAPLKVLESLCLVQANHLGPEDLRILGASPHLGALLDLTGFYHCPGGWDIIRTSKTFSKDLRADC